MRSIGMKLVLVGMREKRRSERTDGGLLRGPWFLGIRVALIRG